MAVREGFEFVAELSGPLTHEESLHQAIILQLIDEPDFRLEHNEASSYVRNTLKLEMATFIPLMKHLIGDRILSVQKSRPQSRDDVLQLNPAALTSNESYRYVASWLKHPDATKKAVSDTSKSNILYEYIQDAKKKKPNRQLRKAQKQIGSALEVVSSVPRVTNRPSTHKRPTRDQFRRVTACKRAGVPSGLRMQEVLAEFEAHGGSLPRSRYTASGLVKDIGNRIQIDLVAKSLKTLEGSGYLQSDKASRTSALTDKGWRAIQILICRPYLISNESQSSRRRDSYKPGKLAFLTYLYENAEVENEDGTVALYDAVHQPGEGEASILHRISIDFDERYENLARRLHRYAHQAGIITIVRNETGRNKVLNIQSTEAGHQLYQEVLKKQEHIDEIDSMTESIFELAKKLGLDAGYEALKAARAQLSVAEMTDHELREEYDQREMDLAALLKMYRQKVQTDRPAA